MAYLGQQALDISLPVLVAQGGTAGTTTAEARANLSVPSIEEVQNQAFQTLSGVSGTNTITASVSPSITAYTVGQTFRFTSAGANTGAVTINISGLGAKAITKAGSTALVAGDIAADAVLQITYDGTRFQLVSGAGGGGSGAVADGVLYEAGTSITNNYTITAGKNALGVKQVSVASGKSLTIPTGSALVVAGAGGQSGTPDQYVGVSGNQTIGGVKNFTSAPQFNGADITGLGVGQTWQSVTRVGGTTYYNTTGKPIWCSVYCTVNSNSAVVQVSINGGANFYILNDEYRTVGSNSRDVGDVLIPAGASYLFTVTGTITVTELR